MTDPLPTGAKNPYTAPKNIERPTAEDGKQVKLACIWIVVAIGCLFGTYGLTVLLVGVGLFNVFGALANTVYIATGYLRDGCVVVGVLCCFFGGLLGNWKFRLLAVFVAILYLPILFSWALTQLR